MRCAEGVSVAAQIRHQNNDDTGKASFGLSLVGGPGSKGEDPAISNPGMRTAKARKVHRSLRRSEIGSTHKSRIGEQIRGKTAAKPLICSGVRTCSHLCIEANHSEATLPDPS